MGTTPVYAFPYAGVNDSPNGPSQGQALAEAVETKIVNVDAAIAALAAIGPSYKRCLGGQRRTANTSSFSAETQVVSTGALLLPANSAIEVKFVLNFNVSAVNDEIDVRFRETNSSGTVVRELIHKATSATVPLTYEASYYYETTTAETKTWVLTVARFSGSGVIVAETGTRVRVYLDGSNSLLSETP